MNEPIEGEVVESRALALTHEVMPRSVVVAPIVTPEEAKARWDAYEALCTAILGPTDYQSFRERGKEKSFKKKSAVKKLQTFFGFSLEAVGDAIRDDLGDGHFAFRVKGRATAPNGRYVEAWAGCSTFEERFDLNPYDDEDPAAFARRQRKTLARAYHDVLSTAETRATNRAAMNLIGAGEVTADEISRVSASRSSPPSKPSPSQPRGLTISEARAKQAENGGGGPVGGTCSECNGPGGKHATRCSRRGDSRLSEASRGSDEKSLEGGVGRVPEAREGYARPISEAQLNLAARGGSVSPADASEGRADEEGSTTPSGGVHGQKPAHGISEGQRRLLMQTLYLAGVMDKAASRDENHRTRKAWYDRLGLPPTSHEWSQADYDRAIRTADEAARGTPTK